MANPGDWPPGPAASPLFLDQTEARRHVWKTGIKFRDLSALNLILFFIRLNFLQSRDKLEERQS